MKRNDGQTEFLSVAAVAEWLGISRPMVYKLIHTGDLPSVQIGRCFKIRSVDVEQYIERNKTSVQF